MSTAVRAAIMLAVLVGVPAAWVYYGPLPEQAQQVASRLIFSARQSLGWESGTVSSRVSKAAPRFDPNFQTAMHSEKSSSLFGESDAAIPSQSPSSQASFGGNRGPGDLSAGVEPLLVRLRGMGVVEYALENWGTGGLFRFHCSMPLTPNDDPTRRFEAIAGDRLAAIRQVVGEVTAWHNARSATLQPANPPIVQ